jgi:hypothetical protein
MLALANVASGLEVPRSFDRLLQPPAVKERWASSVAMADVPPTS